MVLPKVDKGITHTQADGALQKRVLKAFIEAPNDASSIDPIPAICLQLRAMAMAILLP
jgi:hypothetical protein